MAVNPLKIFLFLLGGSAAAGATAFVSGALDPYIYGTDPKAAAVAELPPAAPSDPAAPKGERLPGAGEEVPPNTMAAVPPPEGETNPPATMAAEPPPMAAQPPTMAAEPPPADAAAPPASAPAGPQPPSFDVVRVESDGSVVIAGKALANALVEALHGEAVLASTKATPEGDFAIVLDEPLKPGDYQITLRATPDGGTAIASVETAILSIPETAGGQVLAMVEQPGQASELLTVPEPAKPADAAAAPAETPPVAGDAPKVDQAATPPAQEEKPADVAAAPAETPPAAADAPKTDEAAAPPAAADAPKTDEAATPPAEAEKPAEVASAPAETNPPADQAAAPAEAKVAVEAVEIEGNKIFVAGVGDPGRLVRVYANEIALGETQVGQGGRFLVEAERELPVGEYIIRADLLDTDGVKVIARATVPFEREPGEAIAAVAPGVEQPAEQPAAAEPPAQPPADPGKPADVAAGTDQTPPADAAGTPPPAAEQPGQAEAPAPQPEQPAVVAETPPASEPAPAQPEQPAVVAEPTPPAAQPEQPDVAGNEQPPAAGADSSTPPAAADAATPPATAPSEPAPAEPAPADVASQPAAPAEQPPATDAAAPEQPADVAAVEPPPETASPKLQKVQGAVIIRRGDTLWRISRRVYGRGTRYSTIYLANQTQISDPDRIWPGQVFAVPDKSKEGEAADMSAMGEQMTTTNQ